MSQHEHCDEPAKNKHAELRDTVLKSGFSGVAATVLVVAMCSPAGLGGMIGTSVASGLGFGAKPGVDENSIRFPPQPAPITTTELQNIRDQLRTTEAVLDNNRATTNSEIAFIRSVADTSQVVAYTNAPSLASNSQPYAAHNSEHSSAYLRTASFTPAIDPHLELAELLLPKEPT